jgi:hypothetical protein
VEMHVRPEVRDLPKHRKEEGDGPAWRLTERSNSAMTRRCSGRRRAVRSVGRASPRRGESSGPSRKDKWCCEEAVDDAPVWGKQRTRRRRTEEESSVVRGVVDKRQSPCAGHVVGTDLVGDWLAAPSRHRRSGKRERAAVGGASAERLAQTGDVKR